MLEPLAGVTLVLRSRSGGDFDSMPHIASLVSSYLDGATPDRWSIECACEQGLGLRMLKRLAVHEAAQESPAVVVDPFYRSYLASKGLVAAIRRADDVEVVEWICCEYCPSVVPVNAMGEAAALGRLRALQWLFERYPRVQPSRFVVKKAVGGGQLAALEWLSQRFADPARCVVGVILTAVARGHLEIVRWLHELQHLTTGGALHDRHKRVALVYAITNGHFEIAKFLVQHGYRVEVAHRKLVPRCARSGDLEMVKWLIGHDFARGIPGWMDMAAGAGHLHILKWLLENVSGITCGAGAMNAAAYSGHLDVVQWLYTNRLDGCSTQGMDSAAANGHMAVIQWLHENRTESCTALAMERAAGAGYLDIVQWLHQNRSEGCTHTAMDFAAGNGHLDVVRWLHANRTEGCTVYAMDHAAAGGHLGVVKWMHKHRTEGCTTAAMDLAANRGHLGVVKWLHENRTEGCTTAAMDHTNSIEVLEWLHENRSEGCSQHATDNAVKVGNFEKLLFLNDKRIGVFTEGSVASAFRNSHFEIFQWLRANIFADTDNWAIEHSAVVGRGAQAMFMQFEAVA